MLKRSRQREAIKRSLMNRKDHPTAEMLYSDLKTEYPNISLGTVYRNLSLLTEVGEIQKISSRGTTDRYDGDTSSHNHFFCNTCNLVSDLDMDNFDFIEEMAQKNFLGKIKGHVTYFYGECVECMTKSNKPADAVCNKMKNKGE
ncbi:MAG: transcriptional repressor [Lachnospiraceae bacterium]